MCLFLHWPELSNMASSNCKRVWEMCDQKGKWHGFDECKLVVLPCKDFPCCFLLIGPQMSRVLDLETSLWKYW